MDIKVKGGQVLSGEVYPSGSKNSAVHLLCATIIFSKPIVLENIPEITDVVRLVKILEKLGSKIDWDTDKNTIRIDNSKLSFEKLGKGELGDMRGTSILWGALLARFGKVDFEEFPGGCTLGVRPLEPIFKSLSELGAEIKTSENGVKMSLNESHKKEVWLTEMSPTATTNSIMLAAVINGTTKIIGAASEPQIQDVCNLLIKGGLSVKGVGSSVLEIKGGNELKSVTHKMLSDHYEITTFLALGASTGGEVKVHNAMPEHFKIINNEFSKFNIKIDYEGDMAIVAAKQNIRIQDTIENKNNVVRAQPWPALPVDLLPIFIPLALASPRSYMMFHNWMYEAGLFWTSELNKLGAEVIMCDPHRIIVMAGRKLKGSTLEAPYIIRATVSMVMSAMLAKGESTILNADALYRGHPHFSENLKRLGAQIEEIK